MPRKVMIFVCLLALIPIRAFALEQIVLAGQVTDKAGMPLVGANVHILDRPLGTATDADGYFRFVVPQTLLDQDVSLRASFIGYRSVTARLMLKHGLNERDFVLAIDVLQSEELVVTAMGMSVAKEKLGVTIDKISPQEIANSDESNLVSALSGKVANVEVTSSSGEPGAGAYLRIRGINSITGGTQPLFIVDGSPINNQSIFGANRSLDLAVDGVTQQNRASDINPEDIESIEILKGAAAAAMYGSRAANGVVLVSTKSGMPGRARISYKLSYSFDEMNKTIPLQRRYGQGSGGVFDANFPGSWGPDLQTEGIPTYDHANEIFETGHKFENNLSISGGNDRTT